MPVVVSVVALKTVMNEDLLTDIQTEFSVKTGSSAAVIYGGMKCVERMLGVLYVTTTFSHAHHICYEQQLAGLKLL